jgi:hypothetical protein
VEVAEVVQDHKVHKEIPGRKVLQDRRDHKAMQALRVQTVLKVLQAHRVI